MRRMLALVVVVLGMGACADETMAPRDDASQVQLGEMAALAYGATTVGDPLDDIMARLGRLPADLALTAEQRAQIEALVAGFITATAADRAALAALLDEARAARKAGKSPEEVRAILAGGAAARERIAQAQRALHQAVLSVLTPAQRAALSGREPREPRPCTLTDAQRTEISALRAAFETTHAADIALVRSALERARAAHDGGASREQVRAILAEARAAMVRLGAARVELHAAITAVLTPEQRTAGCFR